MSASNGTTAAGQSGTGEFNSYNIHLALLTNEASIQGDLFHYNVRFMVGAEFQNRTSMTFEGEAEILTPVIFHAAVTFVTNKVRIYGDAAYHGTNDTPAIAFVPFDHITPNQYEDWNVRLICSDLAQFSDSNGIAKFVAGKKVEFWGPVVFKGAVTLVKPIFHGDVKFAAQLEIRDLPKEE